MKTLSLRRIKPSDQISAKELILKSLKERFGKLKDDFNPDLNDIIDSYTKNGNRFIVAELNGQIIGTGALLMNGNSAEIVRVSVKKEFRSQGIGKLIVEALIKEGSASREFIVKTEHDWLDAIAFYKKLGFSEYNRDEVDVYLRFNR